MNIPAMNQFSFSSQNLTFPNMGKIFQKENWENFPSQDMTNRQWLTSCVYTREKNINNTFQSALTCHKGLDGAIINFSKYFFLFNKQEWIFHFKRNFLTHWNCLNFKQDWSTKRKYLFNGWSSFFYRPHIMKAFRTHFNKFFSLISHFSSFQRFSQFFFLPLILFLYFLCDACKQKKM